MGQQRYTDVFRREAVRQVIEKGHAVKDVAERLGISSWSLYAWLRKARAGSGTGARLANKDEEIRRLRGELKRVTEERNILRKAAAYFAKASG
jgi:transposase